MPARHGRIDFPTLGDLEYLEGAKLRIPRNKPERREAQATWTVAPDRPLIVRAAGPSYIPGKDIVSLRG